MTAPEHADGARLLDVFFYGLYMDRALLAANGARPGPERRAVVSGYRMAIGARAAIVPSAGDEVHGVVISLAPSDIEKLYAPPGLDRYRPEAVLARLEDGRSIPALCFNLMEPPAPSEYNPQYSAELRLLARRLGLSEAYIASIP